MTGEIFAREGNSILNYDTHEWCFIESIFLRVVDHFYERYEVVLQLASGDWARGLHRM